MNPDTPLLGPGDPPPVHIERADGSAEFVIATDHAGRHLPRSLGTLGVSDAELERHIAWDIGALGIARTLSALLDAPLVAQRYSRLVIDCNRNPMVPTSIVTVSEWTEVPGNRDLSGRDRERRQREIFDPYHDAIRTLLDQRAASGRRTILVSQHTMTDVYKGAARAMHAAVLYNRDRRFAGLVLDLLRRDTSLVIGDNEPYFVTDETDYTIPHHAEARGIEHVEIEVRQDLVTSVAGQAEWGERLARVLQEAAGRSRSGYGYGYGSR